MPEIGTSVSMSGDGKRSVGHRPQATAPILDSTKRDLPARGSPLTWVKPPSPRATKAAALDPACVKTLRGITAPGILRLLVTLRSKKRKNPCSARHYDQISFRFHTA